MKMEVLACSVQRAGESDCPQQSSETAYIYNGESNCIDQETQTQVASQGDLQEMVDGLPSIECHHIGASNGNFHTVGFDTTNEQNEWPDVSILSENSHLFVDIIESESPHNLEAELFNHQPEWLEGDNSMAVWVKWRGKWRAGIRCSRADWPLSALKAKPTHDRKKYLVVFFPDKMNYSWADTLLVRPINEFPEPIAYKSREAGLEMVSDLNIAHRLIMQKMAIAMLNIVDQFHIEALIEMAHNVMVWKEFALETSRCTGFTDLGRMLLKLQTMISPRYIKLEWMQHSLQLWIQRCQIALTAETVEILIEEISESILWNEVRALYVSTVQPALSSEWKTWKHEVIKWFSTSHPMNHSEDPEQRSNDDPLAVSLQVSRKRPKLEVRRADVNSTLHDTKGLDESTTVEIDSDFFSSRVAVNGEALTSDPCIRGDIREGVAPFDSPGDVADKWGEIVVEAENYNEIQAKDVDMTPANDLVPITPANEPTTPADTGSKNRQCVAFIESKGRQCVRRANDGDVYCCVHLASRFNNSARMEGVSPVSTQMCEGTTVLGTRCKHHALSGFSFCKKHRPHNDTELMSTFPQNTFKRKYEETILISENVKCKDLVPVGDVERPIMVADLHNRASSSNERVKKDSHAFQTVNCIGFFPHDSSEPCPESPSKYSLYCEKHLPSWLKRARNGKSRLISKEVFLDLLKGCCSQEQKLHLHQACELFYKLLKSILSLRNPVPKEVQFQWALSEASRDLNVGKFFTNLVNEEKERLVRIWGFSTMDNAQVSSSVMEEPTLIPSDIDSGHDGGKSIKCKICSEKFFDERTLGTHWMENHKKEAQWLFRGYACAICLDSFTNKKVLESHVQERHHVQFVEQCMLLRCMPCGSHFGNSEELWMHVLSAHPADFQPSEDAQQQNLFQGEGTPKRVDLGNSLVVNSNPENVGSFQKFICKFCKLKFDLLPDLGRHHQAAHMVPSMVSSRPLKKGVRYHAYRLKSGRLSRPKFKKGLAAASYSLKRKSATSLKKGFQAAKSSFGALNLLPPTTEATTLGRLEETHCSAIAKILFSDSQKTKPRPSNGDILSVARYACCKFSLRAALEKEYGVLPDHLYLRAAKLCSEQNIQVAWHQDGFTCPQGCMPPNDLHSLSPLMSLADCSIKYQSALSIIPVNDEWEVDECHYVIDSHHLPDRPLRKAIVLCDDISFGQEPVPVACVIDEGLMGSCDALALTHCSQNTMHFMPWESFSYITKPLHNHSFAPDRECIQLGCSCPSSNCCPQTCDHAYLFDIDYEDAKDIYGISMRGRLPYDENGRNILEEGYLIYECNHMCSCNRNCPNRVLQNGVRVRLEVFKTEKKGWAVRAAEAILRGTFICEYIGEVLDEQEASIRLKRYGKEGSGCFYHVDAHNNDVSRMVESEIQYVIDATRYGNVSRFINHSCSPNLVSYQVLIESMECQRAHIGFYASRDIAFGEELTCSYRNLPPYGKDINETVLL